MRALIRNFQPEESDVLLCVGVECLFFGISQWSLPGACSLLGVIFIGLAYLSAPQAVTNGLA